VILPLRYLLVRWLLGCLTVLTRHQVSKDAELLVFRHENAVLRRQIGRVRYQPGGRLWLGALSRLIPRRRGGEVFPVTPATLLAWHRRLVARTRDYTSRRRPGRRSAAAAIRKLVIGIATDHPARGHRRVPGRTRQARPPDRGLHGLADPARRRDRTRKPRRPPDPPETSPWRTHPRVLRHRLTNLRCSGKAGHRHHPNRISEPHTIRRAIIAFCTLIGRATFTGWVERGHRVGVADGLAAGAHRPVDGGGHSRVPLARPSG
jgi:hypothetical protein